MIFDTNILVYLSKKTLKVENLISEDIQPFISIISYIEALGYPFVAAQDQSYMQAICSSSSLIFISEIIAEETISIRKRHRIKLPDAVIYATALVQNLPLLTNNVKDFKSIGRNVKLINPFDL